MVAETLLKSWFPTTAVPFICNAPMEGVAVSSMATAVSKAGGLGMMAGGLDPSPNSAQLSALDAGLRKAASALLIQPEQTLPIVLGFITFLPSFQHALDTVPPLLEKYRVAGVWLSFPQEDIHGGVIEKFKKIGAEWGLKVFVQVGTVKAARDAATQGADVIVAQGIDAGGHQWAQGSGIVTLVPEIREMLDTDFTKRDIALIAAGGIMDGRGLAAALALGAEGAAMGTKFLSTKESPASEYLKNKLISTSDGGVATIKSGHRICLQCLKLINARSSVHDSVQGMSGFWPPLYDGRAIIGEPYQEHESGSTIASLVEKYKAAFTSEDHSRRVVWCGTGVGLIKDTPSSEDVVKATLNQYKEIISRLSKSK
ncbi:MAG: hypothetical protein M1820_008688 [Bogoriella megaspora]|nr:MAG: hypothetical protein M1820_008688 [Bogoriella megaspora]